MLCKMSSQTKQIQLMMIKKKYNNVQPLKLLKKWICWNFFREKLCICSICVLIYILERKDNLKLIMIGKYHLD